jgi:CHASE2 domain
MIWVRLFILSACLGATGWYLEREQHAGRFQRVDDLFLDFLVANARERLTQPEIGKESPVVLVSLKQEQKAEYGSWPAPPLDWQTILKALHPFEPSVVVIPEPLFWGGSTPEFVPAVSEALLPFPSVVLGVETQLAEGALDSPPFTGGVDAQLPRFQRIDGSLEAAPSFSALITAPDPKLRAQSELGLSAVMADGSLPYALSHEANLLPSVLAQTLARYSSSPYAFHRLRLGPGAGAYLSQGLFLPLETDGSVKSQPSPKITTVNALDLMTGGLADGLSSTDQAALGKGKIIVIGQDHQSPDQPASAARLHAAALTHLLSLPRLEKLTQIQQWLAWSLAVLAAFWIVLRVRRARALQAGVALIFAALVISFLVFQANILWCPPTLPAALIAVGALVGLMLGRGRVKEVTP